jgi:hypothetical protein
MSSETTLAYIAGAMDSDGSFSIRRLTYSMRVRGDATQPTYSERAMLKHVTPQVPHLLKEVFGGSLRLEDPSATRGKPLWSWQATDRQAAYCAASILQFLLVKNEQAKLLIELRSTKDDGRFRQLAYWFEIENPDWRSLPMLTFRQVCDLTGYSDIGLVSQAVKNGTLLALPRIGLGIERPRIPAAMVEIYVKHADRARDRRGRCRPHQLIDWRQRLCERMREINRIGTGNHPISA